MAIQVRCTNADCGKTLNVRDEFAGKMGKCPSCGATVKIPAISGDETEHMPVRHSEDRDPAAPPPRGRRRDEDDDDERRPARRRRDEEDDDERRPARRRRDEEDDEPRPARRRRDEDDDDDYEGPRRKNQKQGSPTGTIVCLSIAAGLLLVLGFIPLFSMYSVSVPLGRPGEFVPSIKGMISLTEGMMVMIFSLVVAACLIAALIVFLAVPGKGSDIFITIASSIAGGWGLTLVLWLLGFIWDIIACNNFLKGNMGGVEIAPGIGLWIGLILAIGVVAVFSTLVSLRGQGLWLYVGEGGGLLLGVLLLCVNVQPWAQGEVNKPQEMKWVKRYAPLAVDSRRNF